MAQPTSENSNWQVICLCAQWCGACREWRAAFDETASAHAGMQFAWVDIEDEAEAMGDVDVETFPTVLIGRDHTPLFLGPIQPSAAQLTRLIASLRHAPGTPVSAEAASLLTRLSALTLSKR